MLVDCVDLFAGVWTIRSVFTYAYILMLMSMDCCDVVNELVDGGIDGKSRLFYLCVIK